MTVNMRGLLKKTKARPPRWVTRAETEPVTRMGSAAVRRRPANSWAQPRSNRARDGSCGKPNGTDGHPNIPGHLLRGRTSEAVHRPSRPADAGNRAVTGELAALHLAD